MEIIEIATTLKKTVTIRPVEDEDFNFITKKRYSFNWKQLKKEVMISKLQIDGEDDILGLIGLNDIPEEKRIEIKLLACSIENRGKCKIYDNIAGCMIAFACRTARVKYGDLACVSLIPKTLLKPHYIRKYRMIDAGWQLYLEGSPLNNLIKQYLR